MHTTESICIPILEICIPRNYSSLYTTLYPSLRTNIPSSSCIPNIAFNHSYCTKLTRRRLNPTGVLHTENSICIPCLEGSIPDPNFYKKYIWNQFNFNTYEIIPIIAITPDGTLFPQGEYPTAPQSHGNLYWELHLHTISGGKHTKSKLLPKMHMKSIEL